MKIYITYKENSTYDTMRDALLCCYNTAMIASITITTTVLYCNQYINKFIKWKYIILSRNVVRLAGASLGLSSAADCGSKVTSFCKWLAANCAALLTVNAVQYATSYLNRCSSGFAVSGGI